MGCPYMMKTAIEPTHMRWGMQHGPAHLQHKMTKWADPYNMGAISKFASCSILKAKVNAVVIHLDPHLSAD